MNPGTEHWMVVNERPDVRMVRGHGSYLEDAAGRRYLDFIQGWAVNCLGHAPTAVRDAIAAQASTVINVGPAFHNEPALRLASGLARLSGLGKVFLANSGAEANEGAVKLARRWGQKHRRGAFEVITTIDGFHGRTLAMTSATGKAGWAEAFPPGIDGFPKVPYGDVGAVERAIGERTVAVMVEPMQGEAGVVMPPDGYLRELRTLCDRHGILLMCDEVQTGMSRTGPLFAHGHEGVLPDVMTLGKGLGGGLPIAALLARDEVSCFEFGDHGSTFGGNALTSAAGLAVLETITSASFESRRADSSRRLLQELSRIAESHGALLRGRGHLFGMVFDTGIAEAVRRRAFEHGLLLNAPRPHVLRFMPALDVGDDEIESMGRVLARSIDECRQGT